MKTGDKVRVIKVDAWCDGGSNLSVGMEGVIEKEDKFNTGTDNDVFDVKFGEGFSCNKDNANLNKDNTYQMNRSQLEVIEQEDKQ